MILSFKCKGDNADDDDYNDDDDGGGGGVDL